MPVTSIDQVIAGLAGVSGARYQRVFHGNIGVWGAGSKRTSSWILASMWRPPTPSSLAAPVTCDVNSLGAFHIFPPAAGKSLYLARLSYAGNPGGITRMWDRLAHVGGALGNSTAVQTITGGLQLPARATGRADVQAFVEAYAGLGGTPTTGTISYTNSSGVAGRTGTFLLPVSFGSNAFEDVTLQAGDTGVASVQSLQLGVSTGATGNLGVTLAVPIEPTVNMARGGGDGTNVAVDALRTGLPTVDPNACLFFTFTNSATTVNRPSVSFNLIEA